jgi:hypothetical protein
LLGNGTIAQKATATPLQSREVPVSRETQKSSFPYWFFAILVPLGILLLTCGGVLTQWLAWMWRTPSTQKVGGPVAVGKQSDPQEEMKTRPVPKPSLKFGPEERPEKKAEAKTDPKALDWSAVGNSRVEGDLEISLPAAIVGDLGLLEYNRPIRARLLCVRLRVENTSKTDVIRWRGWHNLGSAQDEHGNTYRPDTPTKPYQFDANNFVDPLSYLKEPDHPHNPTRDEDKKTLEPLGWTGDRGCPINPGKVYIAYIYFEAPPPASREIRLTLPASVLDLRSNAQWLFRMPISRIK